MEKQKLYSEKKMFLYLKKIVAFIVFFLFSNLLYCQTYEVSKIDSTKRHYIITIKGDNEFFGKIVTEKSRKNRRFKNNPRITERNSYHLDIKEYSFFRFIDKNSYKTETGGRGTFEVDGVKIWSVNDNFSIYESKDLKGLYYIRNDFQK